MTRIMFVVNQHPYEAFAISVARETAKQFSSQGFKILRNEKDKISEKPIGNELIWCKIKSQETFFGARLRSAKTQFFIHEKELELGGGEKAIKKWIDDYNPLIVYSFHCTPKSDRFWSWVGNADFVIEKFQKARSLQIKGNRIKAIEIKAKYKLLPNQIRGLNPYFGYATSHQDTIKTGLRPEELGKEIAMAINLEITRLSKKKCQWLREHGPRAQKPRIKRIYKNPRKPATKPPRRI